MYFKKILLVTLFIIGIYLNIKERFISIHNTDQETPWAAFYFWHTLLSLAQKKKKT